MRRTSKLVGIEFNLANVLVLTLSLFIVVVETSVSSLEFFNVIIVGPSLYLYDKTISNKTSKIHAQILHNKLTASSGYEVEYSF